MLQDDCKHAEAAKLNKNQALWSRIELFSNRDLGGVGLKQKVNLWLTTNTYCLAQRRICDSLVLLVFLLCFFTKKGFIVLGCAIPLNNCSFNAQTKKKSYIPHVISMTERRKKFPEELKEIQKKNEVSSATRW